MSLATSIEIVWQFAVLMLVQSTLLIVGVYLIVKLLRLRDAAMLSVIYRSVLLATLVAPLATIAMMSSEIEGWRPRLWSDRSVALTEPKRELSLPVSETESTLTSQQGFHPVSPPPTVERVPQTVALQGVQEPETVSTHSVLANLVFTFKSALLFAWTGIATLFLVRVWRTNRQLRRTLSKAVPVEPSIQAYCDRLASELRVTPPSVVCSPYFTSPFLTGVLHPIVHLSSEGKDALDHDKESGLRDVLVHELAHLKRHDVLIRMLSQILLSVFFFQPLLKRLVKWLENNAEDVCDDYAMSLGARRDQYAGRLVDLAECCDFPLGSAVGVLSSKSMLKHRVARIMDFSRRPSTRVSRRVLAACGLVIVAAVIGVCMLLTPRSDAIAGPSQQAASMIDGAFEELTAVEDAVHTEQRQGLVFTIHQAKRFANGGVMILSSVRGEEETLKQYRLAQRMTQKDNSVSDAVAKNWDPSPQGSGYFRLKLADANHRGVDAQWWIMVPRGRLPTWFEGKDGKVQLDIGVSPQGEYGKANHADERGRVRSITWKLPLDIPKPERLPSLDEIVASVHSDLRKLAGVNCQAKLCMGVRYIDGTPRTQFGSPSEFTPEEFAVATRGHWERWERGDVDYQIESGGTGYGRGIGGIAMRPGVSVDYLSTVDDTTLARATERSDLIVISARGTKITDAGLAHLSELTKLKKLNVANTSITDDGLRHLEAIKSLDKVDVTETNVTQSGIERLRKSLPNVLVVARENDASIQPSRTDAKSSKSLRPLPSKVTGIVTDSADRPISNARVTVLIRTFSKDMHEELRGSRVWTATTDDEGRYSIAPTGTVHPDNEVRIFVVAEGFADVSGRDYEKKILKGVMPTVWMLAGRQVTGRLVSEGGKAVTEGIVRFQAGSADLTVMWDSGPFPVDSDGRFSLSIPVDGMSFGAIYPTGFAPRFVEVTEKADQGDVVLEKGVALKGQVIDKNGQGVAKTVVGIRKTENRVMHAYVAVIGTAVKTDESGHFQLPALSGEFKLSVESSVPDYSRQMTLDGKTPPPIDPVMIEFNHSRSDERIRLHE